MVFDLAREVASSTLDLDVEIRRVQGDAGLNDYVAAACKAFGADATRMADRFRTRLGDPAFGLFVAYAAGVPAAAGRLEMPPARSFAGLWGSGTVPPFRHRGCSGALVAARAAEARRLGYRYLTVDARHTSRPILE